ncbi:MAG TPA: hypothetical protein VNE21_04635 [Mycobacteriales bacterium]|nr:hypothetical protein [Mycobacteriales bacterium]
MVYGRSIPLAWQAGPAGRLAGVGLGESGACLAPGMDFGGGCQ